MKVSELREKTESELNVELTGLYKEQFNLRMQQGIGQAPRPNQFGIVRKGIARIKTILREKQSAGNDA